MCAHPNYLHFIYLGRRNCTFFCEAWSSTLLTFLANYPPLLYLSLLSLPLQCFPPSLPEIKPVVSRLILSLCCNQSQQRDRWLERFTDKSVLRSAESREVEALSFGPDLSYFCSLTPTPVDRPPVVSEVICPHVESNNCSLSEERNTLAGREHVL